MYEIIDYCEEQKSYSRLIRTLGAIYSSIDSLARSFLEVEDVSPIATALEQAGGARHEFPFPLTLQFVAFRQKRLQRHHERGSKVAAGREGQGRGQLHVVTWRRSVTAAATRRPAGSTACLRGSLQDPHVGVRERAGERVGHLGRKPADGAADSGGPG